MMPSSRYAACGVIGLSLFSANQVVGAISNKYWVDDAASTYAGNLGDSNHWSDTAGGAGGAALPDPNNDLVHFNNAQGTAYEVDLTVNTQFRQVNVTTDKVILDLNDKTLTIPGRSGPISATNPDSSLRVGHGDGVSGELTFTSSTPTKGKIDYPSANATLYIGVGTGTLASTGKLTIQNGAIFTRTRQGSTTLGSEDGSHGILDVNGGSFTENYTFNAGKNADADILVRNGGSFNVPHASFGLFFGANNTLADAAINVTVDGPGSKLTGRFTYGGGGTTFRNNTTILITNGGTASAIIGVDTAQTYGFAAGADGNNTTALTTVEGTGSTMRSGFHYIGGNATQAAQSSHQVVAADGGILGAKARLKVWGAAGTGSKGILTVDSGIIELDGQTTISSVTHTGTLSVGGILRGAGTIRRQAGTGSNLVQVDILGTAAGTWAGATTVSGELRPGDVSSTPAVGTLRIENGNLNLTTNGTQAGTLHVDLADNGNHDQVLLEATAANSGLATASLLGALNYTVDNAFNLSSKPFYDFVIAQDVTYNPLADDLVASLASLGYTVGTDYEYGVVTIAAGEYVNDQYIGYEALRLSQVPEPTTACLLAIGGLLIGRRRWGKTEHCKDTAHRSHDLLEA